MVETEAEEGPDRVGFATLNLMGKSHRLGLGRKLAPDWIFLLTDPGGHLLPGAGLLEFVPLMTKPRRLRVMGDGDNVVPAGAVEITRQAD